MRSGLAPKLHALVDGDANRVTPKKMVVAFGQGDELVGTAIENAATYIGIAAANVVSILHPDLIVLGGGVAEIGEPLLKRVRETIRERVGMFPVDGVRVEGSQLGEQCGLLGAIALAMS